MQEESIITIVLFLTGQTIAIWQKLSKIEQKIDSMQQEAKKRDIEINKIKMIIADKINGAARDLIS